MDNGAGTPLAALMHGALELMRELEQVLREGGFTPGLVVAPPPLQQGLETTWILAVPEAEAAGAREILSAHFDGTLAADGLSPVRTVVDRDAAETDCPACGAHFATSEPRCPDCGLNLALD